MAKAAYWTVTDVEARKRGAVLIEDGLSQKERLIKLNKIAIHQMSILEEQNPKVLK